MYGATPDSNIIYIYIYILTYIIYHIYIYHIYKAPEGDDVVALAGLEGLEMVIHLLILPLFIYIYTQILYIYTPKHGNTSPYLPPVRVNMNIYSI